MVKITFTLKHAGSHVFHFRIKELELSDSNIKLTQPQCTVGNHRVACTIQLAYINKDTTKKTHLTLYDC